MAIKKTVAIIGATGDMGSAIAKSLVNSNYRLLLVSRNKTKLDRLFSCIKRERPATEVAINECEKEASWEADIIFLVVPFKVHNEVAEKIRQGATQKIVLDVSNPLNESHNHLVTEPNTSAAEELQKLLPNSKVVKAFNTIFATDLPQPTKKSKQNKTFIAGDDQEAIQTVSEMTIAMGLQPVLCGSLCAARKLEQMVLQLVELKIEENYNNIMGRNMQRHAPITFKSVIG